LFDAPEETIKPMCIMSRDICNYDTGMLGWPMRNSDADLPIADEAGGTT
jgi:hypothetical protein